jgi:glycosyltransferase involved in cell wall biosynthesis
LFARSAHAYCIRGDYVNQQPLAALVVVNGLDLGGTERMLERMVLHVNETKRVRFTVCSLGDKGPIGRSLSARGIEVIALGGTGGTVRFVLNGILGIRRLLRERRFDLIHSFLYRSHCAARLARLSLALQTPLISSERGLCDNRSRIILYVNRLTSRWSDRILAVSEAVRDRAVQRDRIHPSKVMVIRNGIEAPEPNPDAGKRLRRTLRIHQSEVVFLLLGRLHREKGPDLFLQALVRLEALSGSRAWRAIIVGSGPEFNNLEQSAAALGIRDRVMFAGARRIVGPWIEASDVLVLPSREEGLPVAALEAMVRRKPVIATAVGGTPEIVSDPLTGLLVPPEDPTALAKALTRLLLDEKSRLEMGEEAMKKARSEFSIDRMVNEILGLYEQFVIRPDRDSEVTQDTTLTKISGG